MDNSSCGVHPHVGIEFPSPVQENALQAKHLRCRTHQPIILRFAGAECNNGLSFEVCTDGTATSINAQPETLFRVRMQPAWSVSHQDSIRATRFCHLINQTSLGRTPRKTRASLFNPISSRFDGCCILRASTRSVYSVCYWSIVFARYRSDASLSIGTSPSMSVSLFVTPGVVTDRPVTPNVFPDELCISRICLPGDAISGPFHDPAQHSNALHIVVVSRGSKDASIRDNPELLQFHKESSDIDDVTERNKVGSVYPHTELLQMTVDAR